MNLEMPFSFEDLPERASLSEMAQSWGIPRYTLTYIVDQTPVRVTARQGNKRVYDRAAQEQIARRAALALHREQLRASEQQKAAQHDVIEFMQLTNASFRQQDAEMALLKGQIAELLALVRDIHTKLHALDTANIIQQAVDAAAEGV